MYRWLLIVLCVCFCASVFTGCTNGRNKPAPVVEDPTPPPGPEDPPEDPPEEPTAPVVDLFFADPDSIVEGECTDLIWETTGADSVVIESSDVDADGDMEVCPVTTTVYTLTATGPGGTTTSMVTVEVSRCGGFVSFEDGDCFKLYEGIVVQVRDGIEVGCVEFDLSELPEGASVGISLDETEQKIVVVAHLGDDLEALLLLCIELEGYEEEDLPDNEQLQMFLDSLLLGGEVCISIDPPSDDPPSDGECGECDGKVTELTLQYNGVDSFVEAYSKKDKALLFSGHLTTEDQFTLEGGFDVDKKGTLGTEVRLYVGDDEEPTRIHTSCSMPIGVGLIVGDFEVVSGQSRKGGALCHIDDYQDDGDEDDDDHDDDHHDDDHDDHDDDGGESY